MKLDMFRFLCWIPFQLLWNKRIKFHLVEYTPTPKAASFHGDMPDYDVPKRFQVDVS